MNTNYSENNYLVLVGKITSEKVFSHEIYGESFYIFNLEVPRLSGTADCIPITISERLISNFDLSIGKEVEIEGQFRSYNTYENQRSRLVLTVFAKEIKEHVETEEPVGEKISNEVVLVGYICKKPIYRKTP
ncbi:MAG: single-stranded DNA-binding protein, partial [Clostridia bacterium]